MTDNKTLILNQFEENRGQFVIMHNKVVRLVAIAEDEMDYYYVCYDGRKIIWHSCVGSYTVLKNKIDEKDYNEMIRWAKINHFDQDDFLMPSEEDKSQQKYVEKTNANKKQTSKRRRIKYVITLKLAKY